MQWRTYPDDRLMASRDISPAGETEPVVYRAIDGDVHFGSFAVVARQHLDHVVVVPLDLAGPVTQFEHATSLVDVDRMYDADRFLAGHPSTWRDAVSTAAVEAYVRRARQETSPSPPPDPWDDDQVDTDERDAIEHEPASAWTWLTHPAL